MCLVALHFLLSNTGLWVSSLCGPSLYPSLMVRTSLGSV